MMSSTEAKNALEGIVRGLKDGWKVIEGKLRFDWVQLRYKQSQRDGGRGHEENQSLDEIQTLTLVFGLWGLRFGYHFPPSHTIPPRFPS